MTNTKSEPIFSDRRANTAKTRRIPLDFPKGKKFRILSLDGGGIRGIFGACLLKQIEAELTGGRPISDFFDLVAGTSTGGILGIGVGLEIPAAQMANLYLLDGKEVFPPPGWIWRRIPKQFHLLRRLRRYRYDVAALESKLKNTFKERKLGDAKSRLVIPAFKVNKPEIVVLKNDFHSAYRNDWRTPAWEAARATSAAPTYLPGLQSGESVYLDGGIWANNPIMLAVVEALSAFNVTRDQIEIVSIGTGNIASDVTLLTAMGGGLIQWREIIHTAVFLTSDNADGQAGLLLGPEKIVRLEPSSKVAGIDLDNWLQAKEALPIEAATAFKTHLERLKPFFEEPVTPREYFYSKVAAS